ncbi:hypothetical protein OA326_01370 [Candidatus Pelagibacter sp.]|nr:hypothetical protein [Candidatus Pelagibacter sp.]
MRKFSLFVLVLSTLFLQAHTDHYKNYNKIEMEIFKDNEQIGESIFFFKKENNKFIVKNKTNFNVKLLGVSIFSVNSKGTEVYIGDQLISFNSETFQNDKKKFVSLIFDKKKDKFIIDGSSFQGEASKENIVGNWWNHRLLQTETQISPLSGSVKKQNIEFLGKKKIKLYEKEYEVEHFRLFSTNSNLPDDKKLNFEIWYDKKMALIVKVAYKRLGLWEYRLKTVR